MAIYLNMKNSLENFIELYKDKYYVIYVKLISLYFRLNKLGLFSLR